MKAMLVVDIPNNLKYEKLYFNGEIRYTSEFDRGYVFLKEINRGLMKPLPKRIGSASEYGSDEEYIKRLINWKKEVDEILGEQ